MEFKCVKSSGERSGQDKYIKSRELKKTVRWK